MATSTHDPDRSARIRHAKKHLDRIGLTPMDIKDLIQRDFTAIRASYGDTHTAYRLTPALLTSLAVLPRWRNSAQFVTLLIQHPNTPERVLDAVTHQYLLASTPEGPAPDWSGVYLPAGAEQFVPYQHLIRHPNLSPASFQRLLAISGVAGPGCRTDRRLSRAEIDDLIRAARRDVDLALPGLQLALKDKTAGRTSSTSTLPEVLVRIRMWEVTLPLDLMYLDMWQLPSADQLEKTAHLLGEVATADTGVPAIAFEGLRKVLLDPERGYRAYLRPEHLSDLLLDAAAA